MQRLNQEYSALRRQHGSGKVRTGTDFLPETSGAIAGRGVDKNKSALTRLDMLVCASGSRQGRKLSNTGQLGPFRHTPITLNVCIGLSGDKSCEAPTAYSLRLLSF